MKRFLCTFAVAGLWLSIGATHTQADFSGFNSGTGFTLNGFGTFGPFTPIFSGPGGDTVQLTTTTIGPMAGSVFYSTPQNIAKFTAQFAYQTAGGADGFAFVLQNAPSGASAIGGAGGDLGVGDIEGASNPHQPIVPSAAILFNIWTGHPQGTEYTTNGVIDFNYSSVAPVVLDSNALVHITVTYDGSNLTETLTQGSNTFSKVYTSINLASVVGGNTAYVGFTGGAGGVVSDQYVRDVSFKSSIVPEPASALLLMIGTVGMYVGARVRRGRPTNSA
jgi:hypothetical protein